jgi:ribose transport system substrate-binding protein
MRRMTSKTTMWLPLLVLFALAVISAGAWAQESHQFVELTNEYLLQLAEEISPPMTPAPAGLTVRTPDDLKLTEEEEALLRTMDISTVYLIAHTDVTELLNKQGADEVLATICQDPVPFLGGDTLEQQLDQLDGILAQPTRYSFIMAQPFGQKATADAFVDLSEAGVPLVFAWTPSAGIEGSQSYLGLILDDGYGRGYASAKMLAHALGGEGQVGMINFAVEFFSTDQRTLGAHAAFAEFPGIELVDERGFSDPANAGDTARGMLGAHPEIDGIWTVWMDPCAYEVSDAVKDLGLEDRIVITTTDLGGEAGARRIADDSDPIIGTVDANSVQMGQNMARLGLKYLAGNLDFLGTFAPVTGYPIAKANLVEGFFFSQRRPLPDSIKDMLE